MTQSSTPLPWDQRGERGRLEAFVRSWLLVMTGPVAFYRRLAPARPAPIGYGLGVVGLMVLSQVTLELARLGLAPPGTWVKMLPSMPLFVGRACLAAAIGAVGTVLLVHLGCRIFRAHPHGLRGTVHAFCYALSPTLLAPLAAYSGFPIAQLPLYLFEGVLLTIGLVFGCGVSPLRAVASVVLFPVGSVFLVSAAYVLLRASVGV